MNAITDPGWQFRHALVLDEKIKMLEESVEPKSIHQLLLLCGMDVYHIVYDNFLVRIGDVVKVTESFFSRQRKYSLISAIKWMRTEKPGARSNLFIFWQIFVFCTGREYPCILLWWLLLLSLRAYNTNKYENSPRMLPPNYMLWQE